MQKSVTTAAQKPVGVLILGRKRPGFDQEWNQIICRRALAALKEMGYATVGADTPVIDDATIEVALDKIRAARCQALVMLHPSMGNGQLVLTVAQQWPDPVVLWATPERPGDGKVSSCSLVGQHLWGSTLRQAGHAFELVYGDPTTRFCARNWCGRLPSRAPWASAQRESWRDRNARSRIYRSRGRPVFVAADDGHAIAPVEPAAIYRARARDSERPRAKMWSAFSILKLPMRDVT